MQLSSLKEIVSCLNEADVEFLLVGGLAVVAHGYGRMTHDVDLVINFKPNHLLAAFNALSNLGYKPRIPITGEQFSNKEIREKWIQEKGMMVLNLFNEKMSNTPIDLFVEEPFDFELEYKKAVIESFDDKNEFRYLNIDSLIEMKKKAGRNKDLDDVENLERIKNEV